MIVDAHHHFWKYDPVEYGWIDDSMSAIRRDFLAADLGVEIAAAGVDAVVSVQARQSIEETRQLLEIAAENEFIRGVVGWAPLAGPGAKAELAAIASLPAASKLKAVRHVLQGESDPEYMRRADFNEGVGALKEFGLAYDILIYERQLPEAIRLVDRHPGQVFVLDHIAKPLIGRGVMSPWRENIRELARRPGVYCKMSGLVTEADFSRWTEAQLRPYMEVVLEAFGPRRVMFGSDWPVCLVACPYWRWLGVVRDFVADLSASERERVMGLTAVEAYRL